MPGTWQNWLKHEFVERTSEKTSTEVIDELSFAASIPAETFGILLQRDETDLSQGEKQEWKQVEDLYLKTLIFVENSNTSTSFKTWGLRTRQADLGQIFGNVLVRDV